VLARGSNDAPRAEVTPRAEALSLGRGRYFTGRPCKRGHICERYVSTKLCVECQRLFSAKWAVDNKDAQNAWKRAKYASDPAVREHKLIYGAIWRNANRERMRALVAAWNTANPDSGRTKAAAYRARRSLAQGSFSKEDVAELRARQRDRCAYCSTSLKKKGHVDHILPLALGGANSPANLQMLCAHCNQSKGALHPIVFAHRKGLLL
jgi:hypothetical protein